MQASIRERFAALSASLTSWGAGKSVPRCVSKEDYMAEALAFYTVDG